MSDIGRKNLRLVQRRYKKDVDRRFYFAPIIRVRYYVFLYEPPLLRSAADWWTSERHNKVLPRKQGPVLKHLASFKEKQNFAFKDYSYKRIDFHWNLFVIYAACYLVLSLWRSPKLHWRQSFGLG